MGKKILIDFGNVRIKEYNSMNHVIEVFEEVRIPPTGKIEKRWRFNGYCTTILGGLKSISRKELLIDRHQLIDLNDYVKQVEQSNAKLLEVIE